MADDQEKYLNETPTGKILRRGFKKLLTEATSIKFLLLVFVCVGIWTGRIPTEAGLGFALLLTGLREIPMDALVAKFAGAKNENPTTPVG